MRLRKNTIYGINHITSGDEDFLMSKGRRLGEELVLDLAVMSGNGSFCLVVSGFGE